MTFCTVCKTDFCLNSEGGVEGYWGILPVAFCPTCTSCAIDMVQQLVDYDMDDDPAED